MLLNPLLENIIETLSTSKTPYFIVGGSAMTLHGIPRSTLDIDIYIPAENSSIKWIFETWKDINLTCNQENLMKLKNNPEMLIGQWITFSTEDSIEILDIFIENKKDFDNVYNKIVKIPYKNSFINVASINDLIALKKKSGRPIDFADLELIKKYKDIG